MVWNVHHLLISTKARAFPVIQDKQTSTKLRETYCFYMTFINISVTFNRESEGEVNRYLFKATN